jgi:hypothetical protein
MPPHGKPRFIVAGIGRGLARGKERIKTVDNGEDRCVYSGLTAVKIQEVARFHERSLDSRDTRMLNVNRQAISSTECFLRSKILTSKNFIHHNFNVEIKKKIFFFHIYLLKINSLGENLR